MEDLPIPGSASSPRTDSSVTPELCLNCGAELAGKYCAQCGQRNLPMRQTLGELMTNFISSFWSYESKFFRTGQYLLFKPGFLAAEYCSGRRESYYHPARMYVFISFIYFLLFSSLPGWFNDVQPDINTNADTRTESTGGAFTLDSVAYATRAHYDSAQSTLPQNERDNWFERMLEYREIDINTKYKGRSGELSNDFRQAFVNNFSKVLFFLLPVFALIFKLLYIRRGYYYSEHLVFSIYYYNFFFLAGSVYMLAELIPWHWLNWITVIIALWMVAYMPIAMKRMYKQSWRKTLVKYLLFIVMFITCMVIGLVLNLFLIAMSI